MIEQAFISGPLGKAVYKEDGQFYAIGVAAFEGPVECRRGDLSFLLELGAEFIEISGENITLDDLRSALEQERQKHRALQLLVSGFDADLTEETRRLCIEAAEDLLEDKSVWSFVRNRLMSRVIPSVADTRIAKEFANLEATYKAGRIYAEVLNSQSAIESLLRFLGEATRGKYKSEEERASIEKRLIDVGVFAEMVAAIRAGGPYDIESKIQTHLSDLRFNPGSPLRDSQKTKTEKVTNISLTQPVPSGETQESIGIEVKETRFTTPTITVQPIQVSVVLDSGVFLIDVRAEKQFDCQIGYFAPEFKVYADWKTVEGPDLTQAQIGIRELTFRIIAADGKERTDGVVISEDLRKHLLLRATLYEGEAYSPPVIPARFDWILNFNSGYFRSSNVKARSFKQCHGYTHQPTDRRKFFSDVAQDVVIHYNLADGERLEIASGNNVLWDSSRYRDVTKRFDIEIIGSDATAENYFRDALDHKGHDYWIINGDPGPIGGRP